MVFDTEVTEDEQAKRIEDHIIEEEVDAGCSIATNKEQHDDTDSERLEMDDGF